MEPGSGLPRSAAAAAIDAELRKPGRPRGFSREARDLLYERQKEFVEELAVGAIRRARHDRADVVSADDVAVVDAALRGGSLSRRAPWLEPVGGLFGGVGLSEFIDVLGDDDPGALAMALPVALMLLATALLAAAFVRR